MGSLSPQNFDKEGARWSGTTSVQYGCWSETPSNRYWKGPLTWYVLTAAANTMLHFCVYCIENEYRLLFLLWGGKRTVFFQAESSPFKSHSLWLKGRVPSTWSASLVSHLTLFYHGIYTIYKRSTIEQRLLVRLQEGQNGREKGSSDKVGHKSLLPPMTLISPFQSTRLLNQSTLLKS